MFERQRRFNQACDTGGSVQMTDIRLDRADTTIADLIRRLAKRPRQRSYLYRVSDWRSGAMTLDVSYRSGIDVRDESGSDVRERFFIIEEGRLCLRAPVMPSMLTTNSEVIRQDCLCYLMERYNSHLHDAEGV